jgi:hypothetical protein
MLAFVISELGRLIGTLFDPRVWLLMILCGALGYNSARLHWVLVFAAVLTALSTYEAIGVSAWRGKEVSMLVVATRALADDLVLAYLAYFMVKIARGKPAPSAERPQT